MSLPLRSLEASFKIAPLLTHEYVDAQLQHLRLDHNRQDLKLQWFWLVNALMYNSKFSV